MQSIANVWRKGGFPTLAMGLLVGGLAFFTYAFAMGRPYWPLSIDYSYIYLAGRAWAEDLAPYGDAVPHAAHQLLDTDRTAFVYPPNWYLLARIVALFSPAVSNFVWFILSIFSLIVASALIVASLLTARDRFSPLARTLLPVNADRRSFYFLTALFAGFVAATKAAGTCAFLGQTSMLAFLGQALIVYGVTRTLGNGRWSVIAGLVILMLKPQLGLPFAFALLLEPRTRLAVVIAAGITAMLALPGLIIGGPANVLKDLLAGLSTYGTRVENLPDATSGVPNFLYRLTGVPVSTFAWMGIAAIIGIGVGRLLRARMGAKRGPVAMVIGITLAAGLVVPLHDWDFLLFMPLVVLLVFLDGWMLAAGLAATLLLTRFVYVIERFSGSTWIAHQQASAMAATIAVFIAMLITICIAARGHPSLRAASRRPNSSATKTPAAQ